MLDVFFIIIGLAFLILAGFAVPLLRQLYQAAKNLTATLETLNQRLPKILINIEEMTTNVNSATVTLKKEMESLSLLGDMIRKTMAVVADVESIFLAGVRRPVRETFKTSRALLKGLQVFLHMLYSKKNPDI